MRFYVVHHSLATSGNRYEPVAVAIIKLSLVTRTCAVPQRKAYSTSVVHTL